MYEIFGINFNCVYELYFNVKKQFVFGEENELEDMEALNYLKNLHEFSGELYIVTDVSYNKKLGPFLVDANYIDEFVSKFYCKYGETFYSTDIIIVNFSQKLIWVLFHEGICWLTIGN